MPKVYIKDYGKICNTTNGSIQNGAGYDILFENFKELPILKKYINDFEFNETNDDFLNEGQIELGLSLFKPYWIIDQGVLHIYQSFFKMRYKKEDEEENLSRIYQISRLLLSSVNTTINHEKMNESINLKENDPLILKKIRYNENLSNLKQDDAILLPGLSSQDIDELKNTENPYLFNEEIEYPLTQDHQQILDLVKLCIELIACEKHIVFYSKKDDKNVVIDEDLFYEIASRVYQDLPSYELKALFSCAWNISKMYDEAKENRLLVANHYLLNSSSELISHPDLVYILIKNDYSYSVNVQDMQEDLDIVRDKIKIANEHHLYKNRLHFAICLEVYKKVYLSYDHFFENGVYSNYTNFPSFMKHEKIDQEDLLPQALQSIYNFQHAYPFYMKDDILVSHVNEYLVQVEQDDLSRINDYWTILLRPNDPKIKDEINERLYDYHEIPHDPPKNIFSQTLKFFIMNNAEETDRWKKLDQAKKAVLQLSKKLEEIKGTYSKHYEKIKEQRNIELNKIKSEVQEAIHLAYIYLMIDYPFVQRYPNLFQQINIDDNEKILEKIKTLLVQTNITDKNFTNSVIKELVEDVMKVNHFEWPWQQLELIKSGENTRRILNIWEQLGNKVLDSKPIQKEETFPKFTPTIEYDKDQKIKSQEIRLKQYQISYDNLNQQHEELVNQNAIKKNALIVSTIIIILQLLGYEPFSWLMFW
jgi:hypothetical protein